MKGRRINQEIELLLNLRRCCVIGLWESIGNRIKTKGKEMLSNHPVKGGEKTL